MKKISLLAIACALSLGSNVAMAQQQEVTYVEDPAQGYLFNSFKDNWFITGEGGVNMFYTPKDVQRDIADRFSPAASIYVGKWFSPIIGARIGGSWLQVKGLSEVPNFALLDEPMVDGKYYKQKFNHFGPVADVMINLTNWWCGYHPGRIYNATIYGGLGGYWTFAKEYEKTANGGYVDNGWKDADDDVICIRAGIINSFNVSKHVQISLDVRYTGISNHRDQVSPNWNRTAHDVAAFLGVTYLFNKVDWSAPIVPVCPEPENCDALRARLEAADARIADLEDQLRNCLNRPVETVEVDKAPLATIYYPINVSKLTNKDINVLEAVSEVMKQNPNQKYVLTGWADNYTGNDQINTRLRKNRAAGVEKQLLKFGVPAAQLETTINAGNLCDLGEKFVALDRAVTIEEAE